MSMGSEDTFIFSVLLQTKILHPLLYGLGVYVTKPGKYAMVNCQYRGCGEHKLEKSAASATICGVRIPNSQKYSETLEQLIVHLT